MRYLVRISYINGTEKEGTFVRRPVREEFPAGIRAKIAGLEVLQELPDPTPQPIAPRKIGPYEWLTKFVGGMDALSAGIALASYLKKQGHLAPERMAERLLLCFSKVEGGMSAEDTERVFKRLLSAYAEGAPNLLRSEAGLQQEVLEPWQIPGTTTVLPYRIRYVYIVDDRKYAVEKTPLEKAENLLAAIKETTEEMREAFFRWVWAQRNPDPINIYRDPEYYRDAPIFTLLRRTAIAWGYPATEYRLDYGLNIFSIPQDSEEEKKRARKDVLELALREAKQVLASIREGESWILQGIREMGPRMISDPEGAWAVIKEMESQARDNTPTQRPQEYTLPYEEAVDGEDKEGETYLTAYAGLNPEEDKNSVNVGIQETDIFPMFRFLVWQTAKEVGADEFIKLIGNYWPTKEEPRKSPQQEAWSLLQFLCFGKGIDLAMEKTIAAAGIKEPLAVDILLSDVDNQGREAYYASKRVVSRIRREGLLGALKGCPYVAARHAVEAMEHHELDENLVRSVLSKIGNGKYKAAFNFVERHWREAFIRYYEKKQVSLAAVMLGPCSDRKELRKKMIILSRKIMKLEELA